VKRIARRQAAANCVYSFAQSQTAFRTRLLFLAQALLHAFLSCRCPVVCVFAFASWVNWYQQDQPSAPAPAPAPPSPGTNLAASSALSRTPFISSLLLAPFPTAARSCPSRCCRRTLAHQQRHAVPSLHRARAHTLLPLSARRAPAPPASPHAKLSSSFRSARPSRHTPSSPIQTSGSALSFVDS
jgi:hypothetical protein